jgi:predicted type IV restriction endonuclease
MSIPKRVAERITSALKPFQTVLQQQRARDVSEADTVTIVKDLLSDLFGYDKYSELTSEHSIRGTYCDLAVKLDGKLAFLIEVKAIGLELKDAHVKQAVDYAANQGCEWVALTNGIEWRLYHVLFKKPIDREQIACLNLLSMSGRSEADLDMMYLLTREGFTKSALTEFRDRKDATSRFMLAAIILNSDAVKSAIRREVRRVSDLLIEPEVIDRMLREEVIKRETIEGEQADSATRRYNRNAEKNATKSTEKERPTPSTSQGEPESKSIQ